MTPWQTNKFLLIARTLLIAAAALTAILAVTVVSTCYVYASMLHPPIANYNTGENGLWLGSKWYHGKVTDSDIESLAAMLKEHQFRYAYFHCRDIASSGAQRFPPTDSARHLVDSIHRLCPDVKVIEISADVMVLLQRNTVSSSIADEPSHELCALIFRRPIG